MVEERAGLCYEQIRNIVSATRPMMTGFGSRAGGEIGDEERVQAGGRVIGYFFEANAPGTGTSVLHLDGADDRHRIH